MTTRAGAAGVPDPDTVAAAALDAPTVARLSAGLVGEVATYLPGRRVHGVRVRPGGAEVHVVGRYGPDVASIAADVRAAVCSAVGPITVDVVVDDLSDDVVDDLAADG